MNPISAHRSLGKLKLNDILCWEYERKLLNDFTFSFQNHFYQVEKKQGDLVKPKSTLHIKKHLDGTISAWSYNKELEIHLIDSRCKKEPIKYKYKRFKAKTNTLICHIFLIFILIVFYNSFSKMIPRYF
jgi:hypothetical protein